MTRRCRRRHPDREFRLRLDHKLYNYSYTLEQFGPYYGKTIWLFTTTDGLDLAPVMHSEPPGWQFSSGVGEPVVGTPPDALEWTWSAPVEGGVPPGSKQAGFSFTTSLPPATVRYQLDQAASPHSSWWFPVATAFFLVGFAAMSSLRDEQNNNTRWA